MSNVVCSAASAAQCAQAAQGDENDLNFYTKVLISMAICVFALAVQILVGTQQSLEGENDQYDDSFADGDPWPLVDAYAEFQAWRADGDAEMEARAEYYGYEQAEARESEPREPGDSEAEELLSPTTDVAAHEIREQRWVELCDEQRVLFLALDRSRRQWDAGTRAMEGAEADSELSPESDEEESELSPESDEISL
jgi:hypothetical protein